MSFNTVSEIRAANRAAGQHFFDPGTMRAFNSEIVPGVIAGRLFITAERMELTDPRRYTVRQASPEGRVWNASDSQQFETVAEARTWARAFAAGEVTR